jgi:protein involved in polysaccharide export with SLBB domain
MIGEMTNKLALIARNVASRHSETYPKLVLRATMAAAIVTMLALLVPCSHGQEKATTNSPTVSPGTVTNAPTSPYVSLRGYVPDDKYKLRVGDRVSLQILEDRDPPKSLLVADSGELDVPYIGRISATDKSCRELSDIIKVELEKDYYYRASVIVALDSANKLLGRIYVWGQVKNQGPIDIAVNENLTVGKAILRAGGFGDFAKKNKVRVVRPAGTEGGENLMYELDMVEILEKGRTDKDLVLMPEDSIIVPVRTFNF